MNDFTATIVNTILDHDELLEQKIVSLIYMMIFSSPHLFKS